MLIRGCLMSGGQVYKSPYVRVVEFGIHGVLKSRCSKGMQVRDLSRTLPR